MDWYSLVVGVEVVPPGESQFTELPEMNEEASIRLQGRFMCPQSIETRQYLYKVCTWAYTPEIHWESWFIYSNKCWLNCIFSPEPSIVSLFQTEYINQRTFFMNKLWLWNSYSSSVDRSLWIRFRFSILSELNLVKIYASFFNQSPHLCKFARRQRSTILKIFYSRYFRVSWF